MDEAAVVCCSLTMQPCEVDGGQSYRKFVVVKNFDEARVFSMKLSFTCVLLLFHSMKMIPQMKRLGFLLFLNC